MLDKTLFYIGIFIMAIILLGIKKLDEAVANSDLKEKKAIDFAFLFLALFVAFGGVGLLYKCCPPF